MPHINYRRGETRTFVVRRHSTRKDRRWIRVHGRCANKFNLWKDYRVLGLGYNFRCSCCAPDPTDVVYRRVRRRLKAQLRRLR